MSELRQYHNNNQFTTNLNPVDYFLVLTEKTGKYDWPTAVVTDVFKGRDGLVRTVEVKLPHSAADIDRKGHPLKQIKQYVGTLNPLLCWTSQQKKQLNILS